MRNGPEDECDEAVEQREYETEELKRLQAFEAQHLPQLNALGEENRKLRAAAEAMVDLVESSEKLPHGFTNAAIGLVQAMGIRPEPPPGPRTHAMNLTAREMGLLAYAVAVIANLYEKNPGVIKFPKQWYIDLTNALVTKGENSFTDEEFEKALELPADAATVAVPIPTRYDLN